MKARRKQKVFRKGISNAVKRYKDEHKEQKNVEYVLKWAKMNFHNINYGKFIKKLKEYNLIIEN